ncbi:Lysine-specific demethylase 3A [Physocladia obscura]|uniref:Lysine-specific demethylase 3A n=1 Tax=Physocladia obscura TaxID=109957 RepID=A0AAD5SYB9_9FUNG|nr:Lysine-specific demethylase 3A [Physocladia obscura]
MDIEISRLSADEQEYSHSSTLAAKIRSFFAKTPPSVPIDPFYFGLFMDLAIQRLVTERDVREEFTAFDADAPLPPPDMEHHEILIHQIQEPEIIENSPVELREKERLYADAVTTFKDKFSNFFKEESDAKRLKLDHSDESPIYLSTLTPGTPSNMSEKKSKKAKGGKSVLLVQTKKSSPCFRMFKRICISCGSGNGAAECRLAAERDLQGNVCLGAELITENQITRPRGIDRVATRDEDKFILQRSAHVLVPILDATSTLSSLIPPVETFKVRIRPKTGYIQCDSCDAFLFMDHVRCMQCGQDFCLDCFAEWTRNPTVDELLMENTSSVHSQTYRLEAFSKCSLESRHSIEDFSFWTFITPFARQHIYLHAQKSPISFETEFSTPPQSSDHQQQQTLPIRLAASVSELEILRAWRLRQPIVISGIEFSEHTWSPQELKSSAVFDDIINTRRGARPEITQMMFSFFSEALILSSSAKIATPSSDLKGFDFPVVNKIDDVFPDHWKEYRTYIPFRRFILRDGPMSLFSFLSNKDYAALHGATLFIGDASPAGVATTRLHKDSASAYNTLLYANNPENPGAIWHLFSPENVRKIQLIYDKPVEDSFAMLDFNLYFNDDELTKLDRDHGIQPVVVKQFAGEMILIPAGWAHQISQDVITAECLSQAISLDKEIRLLAPGHDRRSSTIAPVGMAVLAWDRLNKYNKKTSTILVASSTGLLNTNGDTDNQNNAISGLVGSVLSGSGSALTSGTTPIGISNAVGGSITSSPVIAATSMKGKLDGRGRPGITTMMAPVQHTEIRAYSQQAIKPQIGRADYIVQNKPCFHPFFSRFLRCGICHPRNPAGRCVFINVRVFQRDPADPKKVIYGPWFLRSRWNVAAERMQALGIVDDWGDEETDQMDFVNASVSTGANAASVVAVDGAREFGGRIEVQNIHIKDRGSGSSSDSSSGSSDSSSGSGSSSGSSSGNEI